MNNEQKQQLINHMKQLESDSFESHAQWATRTFEIIISPKECQELFFDSLC